MDSEYLKTHLGLCLSDALAEVAEKRPLDPIEYIAQFLLKFKENEAFNKKLMQDQRTMSEELQQADDEENVRGQLSTEAKLIKQREEEAIKARRIEDTTPEPTLKDLSNKPGAPSLTAVVEDEETTSPVTRLVMLESQSEPGIDLAVNNIPMVTVTANTPCDEVIPDEALDDKTVADLPKINDDVPNVPKTDDDVPDVPKIDDDVPDVPKIYPTLPTTSSATEAINLDKLPNDDSSQENDDANLTLPVEMEPDDKQKSSIGENDPVQVHRTVTFSTTVRQREIPPLGYDDLAHEGEDYYGVSLMMGSIETDIVDTRSAEDTSDNIEDSLFATDKPNSIQEMVSSTTELKRVGGETLETKEMVSDTPVSQRFVSDTPETNGVLTATLKPQDVVNDTAKPQLVGSDTPEFHDVVSDTQEPQLVVSDTPEAQDVVNDIAKPQGVVSDTPEPQDVVNDTPEPQEVVSDTQEPQLVVSDTPEPQDMASDTPEPQEVFSDTPELQDVVNDIPKPQEVVSDTPELQDMASDIPEPQEVGSDTPELQDVVNDIPKPQEVVSDTLVLQCMASDTPEPQRVVSDTLEAQDVVNDTAKPQGVVSDTPKAQDVVNDSPKPQGVVSGTPESIGLISDSPEPDLKTTSMKTDKWLSKPSSQHCGDGGDPPEFDAYLLILANESSKDANSDSPQASANLDKLYTPMESKNSGKHENVPEFNAYHLLSEHNVAETSGSVQEFNAYHLVESLDTQLDTSDNGESSGSVLPITPNMPEVYQDDHDKSGKHLESLSDIIGLSAPQVLLDSTDMQIRHENEGGISQCTTAVQRSMTSPTPPPISTFAPSNNSHQPTMTTQSFEYNERMVEEMLLQDEKEKK